MPPPPDATGSQGAASVTAFLASAPLTAQLDDDARRRLAERLQLVRVVSGEYLLRQGEEGDCLYLLVSGRLGVIAESSSGPRLVARIYPGAVVGELAVLAGIPRLASVLALRNSTLLQLSRADFDDVSAALPAMLRSVTRTVVQRLAERGTPTPAPDRTIAVVAGGSSGDAGVVDACAAALRDHLARYGQASLLRPGHRSDDDVANLLHNHEEQSAFVVLTPGNDRARTGWCVRHADAVVLVGVPGMRRDDLPSDLAAVRANALTAPDILLALHHDVLRPGEAAAAMDAADVEHVFAVEGNNIGRVARFLAGRAVGVALGGGGARGFAHLGALRALDEAGVAIDAIGGTSIGALVAAFYAIGWDADEREMRAREALAGSGPLFGVALPVLSLSSATRLQRLLADERYLGGRTIEELAVPFCCVSADLGRAETVVHQRGPLALSVRASLSLPGVLPPVALSDRWLVDGGVLDNLPVAAVRERNGGGPIIAVDIRPRIDLSLTPKAEGGASGRTARGRTRPAEERGPSLVDVLVRSNILGSIRAQSDTLAARPVELLLRPPVESYRILDFRRAPALIQTAYEHTVAALEDADPRLWP